jgi:hypothetical protein
MIVCDYKRQINIMMKTVLGIETSCDDTSLAILRQKNDETPEVLSFHSFSSEMITWRKLFHS